MNITQIRIDTEYLPPIILNDPFSPDAAPGASSFLLRLLKPQVTVKADGLNPITATPWGAPGSNKWPIVQLGLMAFAAGGIMLWKRK